MFKVGKVKIVLNDKGIQKLLKSEKLEKQLIDYGNQIALELDGITDSEQKWEVQVGERPKRLVLNILNTDSKVKWKEISNGKIAKHMASKKFTGRAKK
jgi:hypothetical protein